MINTITIITDDFLLLQKSKINTSENIVIAFCIENIEAFDKFTLFPIHNSVLLKNLNIHYSLYLDFTDSASNIKKFIEHILSKKDFLIQYFFHPKYKIIEEKPMICFNQSASENNLVKGFIELFDKYLSTQGYSEIFSVNFIDNTAFNNNKDSNVLFDSEQSPNEIESVYNSLLNKQFYSSKFLGLKSTNFEKNIIAIIESEEKVSKENPLLYDFLTNLNSNKKLLDKANWELKLTLLDLENQKKYLELLKDQDESQKINEFYHNEYEILPLWYKKLGHILKALIGKRTLRSLFDNNVKKYKD